MTAASMYLGSTRVHDSQLSETWSQTEAPMIVCNSISGVPNRQAVNYNYNKYIVIHVLPQIIITFIVIVICIFASLFTNVPTPRVSIAG